jgi:uncharacterized protein
MDKIDEAVLQKFRSLLSRRIHVNQLILFGSRARGDADLDSDMDVLVVIEELDREAEEYISDCAWEAGFDRGIVVVPVVFTRHEWEEGLEHHSLLVQAVEKEGIPV